MARTKHALDLQLLNRSVGRRLDATVREHIETCGDCQQRARELADERAAFAPAVRAEQAVELLLERRRERRRVLRRQLLRWTPAAAVALALVVWWPSRLEEEQQDTDRLKGALAVHVYVKRGDVVTRAGADFRYQPGDHIRLGVLSPTPTRLTVLATDAQGSRPLPRLSGVAVPAGEEVVLPGSLVLDCKRDAERLDLRFEDRLGTSGPLAKALVLQCGH